MKFEFSVSLARLIKEFELEEIYIPRAKPAEEIMITSTDIHRPGINLTGFLLHIENSRIQIFGMTEIAYLETLPEEERLKRCNDLFAIGCPVIVVTRSIPLPSAVLEAATNHQVAVVRTDDQTSEFVSTLNAFLNVELGPRITRHGVLVEVYGEGLLIVGDSGVGKSETAIELVKRGHRLIADDAVEIKRVSNKTLVGSSPDNIRHFIELRGVGIINARRLFGMGAIKMTEKIDLIIKLEPWDKQKEYDRMGLDEQLTPILDINIPSLKIPVKPGRNLAIIIEVAAMNNRQKKMGYNAAKELMENLGVPVEPTKIINEEDFF